MIHVRVDQQPLNSKRRFACGLGPNLPEGDKWFYDSEYSASKADCPGCNPGGPKPLGWLASAMNGNASDRRNDPDGWDRWVAFCDANGEP
jgi:hypothetical protein